MYRCSFCLIYAHKVINIKSLLYVCYINLTYMIINGHGINIVIIRADLLYVNELV